MIRNLALVAVSLVVAFLTGELVLRQLFAVPPTWKEPQNRHLESPLLGWVLEPGSRSFTIDQPVTVNSLGLRDDEIPQPKPDGETRILGLGDSFTFALGVAFEDLWVQQLERLLRERYPPRAFQVINAGVAGYNTRQELVYLRTQGLALDPDLVVVAFYWNDLIGNDAPLPDLSLPRIDPEADLHGGGHSRHLLPSWIRDRLRSSVLVYQTVQGAKQLLHLVRPSDHPYVHVQRLFLDGDQEALAPYWEATGEKLLALHETAQERGIPIVLMAFPMELQTRRQPPGVVYAERLQALWEPTGMPFVDLGPAYRASLLAGENPFLPYDLHPNATGMRIAAEALLETFEARPELLGLPH